MFWCLMDVPTCVGLRCFYGHFIAAFSLEAYGSAGGSGFQCRSLGGGGGDVGCENGLPWAVGSGVVFMLPGFGRANL